MDQDRTSPAAGLPPERETIETRTGSAAPAVFGLFAASAALDTAIKDLETAGFEPG